MKSYTSFEQSERLAEILPPESADMQYYMFQDGSHDDIPFFTLPSDKGHLPCWTLAALIDLMPLEVSLNKQTDGTDIYYYMASYETRYFDVYSQRHLNAIDACVEMALKLHERKVL